MNRPPGNDRGLEADLIEATQLMTRQPQLAEQKARDILRTAPDCAPAVLLLGVAQRRSGQLAGAIETLESLVRVQPNWVPGCYQLGVTLAAASRVDDAVSILGRAVRLMPDFARGWALIADCLVALGDPAGADRAYANQLVVSYSCPELTEPAAAFCEDRFLEAETLLRRHLERLPDDPAALGMLGEILFQLRRPIEAEPLLRRCLELAPGFSAALSSLSAVLHSLGKSTEALLHLEQLLGSDPNNPHHLNLKANVLTSLGEFQQAIDIFSVLVAGNSCNPRISIAYGDALKTVGRVTDSIEAYRHSISLAPSFGEAYWSLANLKTYRFTSDEVEAMRRQLAAQSLSNTDRAQVCFALGKALEDDGRYDESYSRYAEGNRLRRKSIKYDPAETSDFVCRSRALFSEDFLRRREGCGDLSSSPIFVIGLPRSGSTLVEQILCSHSEVEGTRELTDVTKIARSLVEITGTSDSSLYPEVISTISADDFRSLGERYLEQTRVHRKLGRSRFVDKMPNNWTHVGLIHLMLPHAKIVDVRRHPLACGFSLFKQYFARGQYFSYDLADIGSYYRDYTALMRHFDEVLPGRVHRVFYEQVVENTEFEVRRLLEYCGLDYEDSCLRFFETERPVPTPSSEQVKRPIFDEAVDQWRCFESWLGPLKEALGPALEAYLAGR